MVKVKLFITIEIDEEEYPIPADGQVGEELEYFYDIDGAEIRTMKTLTE